MNKLRQGSSISQVTPGALPGRAKVNAVIRAVNKFLNLRVKGGKLIIGDDSALLEIQPDANASSSGGGTDSGSSSGEIKMFIITELPIDVDDPDHFYDYFIAREWDGLDLGTEDIPIAKHPYHRPSIAQIVVNGVTLTFTYTGDNFRTNTTSSGPQTEQLIMPFEVGDAVPLPHSGPVVLGVVFAAKPANGTGVNRGATPVEWIDLTPRYWARYT